MKSARVLLVAAAVGVSASACTHEKPNFIYMPDMVYSPAMKAQGGGMLKPVAGTVPRNWVAYPYSKNQVTDAVVINHPMPVRPTPDVLARGQARYTSFCLPCHGPNGEGDGTIVPKFPRPPSLQSDKVRAYTPGQLFHVMTMGQNLMPKYSLQIEAEDRAAIAYYVKALQKAKHPSVEDLKAAEQQ